MVTRGEHVDEMEEVELQALVPPGGSDDELIEAGETSHRLREQTTNPCAGWRALSFVPTFLVVLIFVSRSYRGSSSSRSQLPVFQCPASMEHGAVVQDDTEWYESDSQKILKDLDTFMANLQEKSFDGWNENYSTIKRHFTVFKSKHFGELQSGSTVYESACGIGLNLRMTLEILEEQNGITDLVVYGNEYLDSSVKVANAIFERFGLPGNGRLGQICQGDSANIGFIPSNTFDLVYSGYITPLWDPLELEELEDDDDKWRSEYLAICDDKTAEGKKLQQLMEDKQEKWHSDWFKEMIRIAKPGVPVIVESVGYPICVQRYDWGGVRHDFWLTGAQKFDWDIDPDSVIIEAGAQMPHRYNVVTRKKGA